jgi:predicted transcriptional regulator
MNEALSDKKNFLLSIRPVFAELIVDGEKTVELRRRFTTSVDPNALALIYCTSPTQAIIGVAHIQAVERLPINKLWSKHSRSAKVNRDQFDEYFSGLKHGYAIILTDALRFEKKVAASKLRKLFGFVAPQSFAYLSSEYYALLENDRLQASY